MIIKKIFLVNNMKKFSHFYIGESKLTRPIEAEAEPKLMRPEGATAISNLQEYDKLIKEFKINTCYTLTISANNTIIKQMVNSDPMLFWKKFVGMFLENNSIKKCLYTIEKSNKGKYHIHGIIKSTKKLDKQLLKEKYQGYQIYVQRLKKGETYNFIHKDKPYEHKYYTRYTNWLEYILKDPLSIIHYEYGKNFIKYKINDLLKPSEG